MTDAASPTVQPLQPKGLNRALADNIAALRARRREEDGHVGLQQRIAGAVTRFTGSLVFVYVHLAILAAWVAINVLPGAPAFDRTFVILATAASVEAIFLSTFVLISQNHAAAAADRRSDLDLQINLLAEHEVTRLIVLVQAIATRLGVAEAQDEELPELERDIAPEAVLEALDKEK